jgi:hypothetical protein
MQVLRKTKPWDYSPRRRRVVKIILYMPLDIGLRVNTPLLHLWTLDCAFRSLFTFICIDVLTSFRAILMLGVRRFGLFRPTLTQTRCQSAGAMGSSNTLIPERIAKFRRTVAPIAREHLGVSVPSKFCEHKYIYKMALNSPASQKSGGWQVHSRQSF